MDKILQSPNVTPSSSDSCASDDQLNQNSSVSSEQTSIPENNSRFPEFDDSFTPEKSLSDSLSSVRSIEESNGHYFDQIDSEASSYKHLTNEGIVKSSPGSDTKEAKHVEDLYQLQSSSTECASVSREENSFIPVDQKTGMQHVHTNAESSVANSSMLLLNNRAEDLDSYQTRTQGPSVELPESISRPSSAASSERSGLETTSGDFENVLAAFQKECFELQLEIKELKEQLKQSEDEKQKLQAELGKFLFLEEKEKRRGTLLGGAALFHDPGSDIHSGQSLSARENRLSGHENSFKLTLVQDYSLGVQLNRHERKQLLSNQVFIPASIRGDSMDLQGDEENNKSLATTEAEIEQDQNSSLAFSESSRETNTYTAVSSESDKSSNSSMKSALSVEEFPQFTTLTSDGSLSNCNDSSLLSSSFGETTMVADSSCTLQSSSDFVDSRDRAIRTVHSGTSADTGRDSSDSFVCETFGTQSGANGGNLPLTQQGTSSTAGRVLRTPSSAETDWEHLGARPKEVQRSDVEPEPTAPVFYITDGLAGDFLARHTQDKSLQDSIYQTDGVSLFNDIPLQGTSFIDGDISQFSKAQTYFGDCQAASGTEPYGGTRNPLIIGSNRHFGGPSYAEPFSDNSGLWPSHLGNGSFSLYSNFLSRNTSATANNYSPQSDFARSSSRFARVDHFDGEPYLPSAQQVPYPPTSSDSVLNSYPGMTGSSFADPSWTGAALTLPGDPVHNVPRFSSFLSEQLTDPAHDANRFVGNDGTSAFISNQGTDEPAEKTNLALGNSRTTTGNIDNEVNSSALYQLGTSTTFDSVLAVRSTHDTSVLEPRLGDTDNNGVCMLNKRDFDTDSLEASDNSLLALELRVAEACALVERVFREREEREQFEWEIERKEQLIREQRARERREREERELPEAENWPQQQEAIAARSQWVCEHYQRHCRVRFPCCTQFYPCHHCHNISKACDNEEAKACHATHLKCSHCQHEQKIGEDSAKCRKCGEKMSAYFCAICKHFTSVDRNPYHCEKCGICRIDQDQSFHCEVCNVCLENHLEGNHKCRPESGHDECCICLEDSFSGCQMLPCSHRVHRECAIHMIQNDVRRCPICQYPIFSSPGWWPA